jgi:hypothetical protein
MQLYATGPVTVWVKFPMDDEPQPLGYGERAPVVDVTPTYRYRYADASPDVPLDALLTGLRGTVSVDLAEFNMNVLQALRTRARNATFPRIDPGFGDAGQYGMPLIASGCAPVLYLHFTGSEKPAYTQFVSGNLPDGYRFFAAILSPENLRPGGTTANYKTHLAWDCLPHYNRDARSQYGKYGRGTKRLYDEDMTEVVGRNPFL